MPWSHFGSRRDPRPDVEPVPLRTVDEAAAALIIAVLDAPNGYDIIDCSLTKLSDGAGWVWDVTWRVHAGNTRFVSEHNRRLPVREDRVEKVLAKLHEARETEAQTLTGTAG